MTIKRRWALLLVLLLLGGVLAGAQVFFTHQAEQRVAAALERLPAGVEARYENLETGLFGRSLRIHDLVLSHYGEPALHVDEIHVMDYDRSSQPPHHMRLKVSGVEQNLRALPQAEAKTLERLGYTTWRGGYVIDYDYDPDTRILELHEFSGELEGIATLRVALDLHDFDLAQATRVDAPRLPEFRVARAQAVFRDYSFAARLIEQGAREAGIGEERYRALLDAEIAARVDAWNTPFARQLGSVLRQHLQEPGTVVIRLEPERPVSVYEVITAAIIDPAGLPARLGMTVEGGE